MADIPTLRKERAPHRRLVTLTAKKAKDIISTRDINSEQVTQLRAYLSMLKNRLPKSEEYDSRIATLITDDEELDKEVEEANNYQFYTYVSIEEIEKALRPKVDVVRKSEIPVPTTDENITERSRAQVKLPNVNIDPFDGEATNYPAFIDSFKRIIHGNSSLADIEKFYYLRGLLKGKAKKTVEGLNLSEENYKEAIDLLEKSFMLSKRIQRAYDGSSFLVDAYMEQYSNSYHPITNPHGIINFGTSENKIIFDVIQERLSNISFKSFPRSYAYYNDFTGVLELRKITSEFVNHYMRPTLKSNPENIFVLNGAGSAIEILGFALCDDGDMMLTPAPYYGAFTSDLYQRFGVLLNPIHLTSDGNNPYDLTVDKLRTALNQAKREGKKIKALLLTNPNNPLGRIYSLSELEMYAQFCYENNLHLVCDEIYYFSTRDESGQSMHSILSLENFQKYRDIIHVVWGFSKDFGLSGFRCGIIITYWKDLQRGLKQVSPFTSIPTSAQYILIELLSDRDWFDRFVLINRKRLNKALSIVIHTLKELSIPYVWPAGGLYIWIKLHRYLQSDTIESERELFRELMRNGIYVAPGLAFDSKERGWFRIVMSIDENELRLGLKRFKQTLKNIK